MKLNRILGVVTLVLFGLSFWAYHSSQAQAERFERGQKFLPNLNPDNIHEILVDKGEDHLDLKRGEDSFRIVSKNGYPAKNEAVNRLINSILDIELNSEIGTDPDLVKELEVGDGFSGTSHVVFKDASGKEMVNFYIGKNTEDSKGTYVKKSGEKEETYLTAKSVYLTTSPTSFLKDEILNVAQAEIQKIQGNGLVLNQKDGALTVANLPKGMEPNSTELGQLKGILTSLKMKDAFLADNAEVQGLSFSSGFTVNLKDKIYYKVAAAKKGERMFIKVQGGHHFDSIQLTGKESEEEMKEKSKILQKVDELKKFNDFHGSWVYELNDYVGKKFFYSKEDLIKAKDKK